MLISVLVDLFILTAAYLHFVIVATEAVWDISCNLAKGLVKRKLRTLENHWFSFVHAFFGQKCRVFVVTCTSFFFGKISTRWERFRVWFQWSYQWIGTNVWRKASAGCSTLHNTWSVFSARLYSTEFVLSGFSCVVNVHVVQERTNVPMWNGCYRDSRRIRFLQIPS